METIAQSGNLERAKFMEGASWIAKKGVQESNKCAQKLYNLVDTAEEKVAELGWGR